MPNAWDAGSAGCSRRWASRRSPRRAAGSPPRSAGSTARSPATRRSRTRPPSSRPRDAARCRPTSRTGSPTTPTAWPTTVAEALEAGLAGCSIEDYSGRADDPIYDLGLAAERVAAAAEVAHAGPVHLVLTARAENHIHGTRRPRRHDRPAAGVPGGRRRRAVRPGPRWLDDIRRVVSSVDLPVNVLALPGAPHRGRAGRGRGARASRSAGRSPSPRSARWSRPAASCSTRAPTATGPSGRRAAPPSRAVQGLTARPCRRA